MVKVTSRVFAMFAILMLLGALGFFIWAKQPAIAEVSPPTVGCNVVNVSNKTLTITISLIDPDGQLQSVSPPTGTPAGTEVSGDFGDPTVPAEAYCKVQVSGTRSRDDLRVVLTTNLIRTFDAGSWQPDQHPCLCSQAD